MNKKEISEIKKQFTPSHCAITRICGCYVDGEKEKKSQMKEMFLSLPDDDYDRKGCGQAGGRGCREAV